MEPYHISNDNQWLEGAQEFLQHTNNDAHALESTRKGETVRL